MWLGVDVGAERKGFDAALIDTQLQLVELGSRLDVGAVAQVIRRNNPEVVAIDSPRVAAADGARHRECELLLNSSVCGIRWTPDTKRLGSSPYYAWILCGLKLYEAVTSIQGPCVIEVFPTASWTRWLDPRFGSRARWTREGLRHLPLTGVPARTNQDQRDAIAAALTAWQFSKNQCELFGEIAVPLPGVPTR